MRTLKSGAAKVQVKPIRFNKIVANWQKGHRTAIIDGERYYTLNGMPNWMTQQKVVERTEEAVARGSQWLDTIDQTTESLLASPTLKRKSLEEIITHAKIVALDEEEQQYAIGNTMIVCKPTWTGEVKTIRKKGKKKESIPSATSSTSSIQTAIPGRIQGKAKTTKSTLSSVSSSSLHFLKQVALNPTRPSSQSAVTMGTSEKRKIVFATVSSLENDDFDMPTVRPPSQHSTTLSEAENSINREEHYRFFEAIAWLVTQKNDEFMVEMNHMRQQIQGLGEEIRGLATLVGPSMTTRI